ncbi:hypothetical protein [Candidatus Uabimicrobium amorphum]|uniref:Uncharacterized protein n=1 Tax=Uabimicrobium amorphum TaxID=2596890 RepID=A0A5S9IRA9_UABAM|nr:hypothetical protein [Candidatus Uabimicrobium amorphum]BBM85710.1 hypothetical protein UABAM_04085 [Candidatus Uabimicrobium amorphum]
MNKILLAGITLICLSCTQNGTLDNNNNKQTAPTENSAENSENSAEKTTEVNTQTKTTQPPSENIKDYYEKAQDIVANKEALKAESDKLDKQQNCEKCAVIAAATYYLANDKDKASSWAEQAYVSGQDKVEFLPTSRTINTDQSLTKQRQLAQAKDFIISKRDKGTASFKKGNIQFLGLAQYKKATKYYKEAIQKGIENSELRKECTRNLAICLYHSKYYDVAKNLIIYTWLVHPDLQINVGEEATREALKKYIRDYQQMHK